MSRIRRCIVACLLALVLMISAISVGIADDNKNQTLDQARAFVYANGNSKYYYSFGEFMYINILKEPEKYFMCMNAKEDIGETSANMAIVYDYMMNGELSDIGEYAQLALFEKLIILNILASYTEYTYPDEISIAGNFSECLDELNDAFSATNNVNDIWALISDTKGLLPEDIPSDALDIVVDFASEGGDWLKATGEYLCAYQYRENYITMINDMLDVCSDKYISIALRDILDLLEQSDASIGMKQLMQQGAANISYNIVMTICEEVLSSVPFINVVTTVRDLSGYIINNTIFNFSEYNVRVRTVDVLKRFEIALVEAARNANSAYYNDPTPENASRVCFMFDMVYRTLLCDMDVFEEFAELWDDNKYNGLPQNVDFMRNSIKTSYQNVQNIDFESIMAIQNTEIPSLPVIDEDYKFVDEVYADLDGDAQDELVVLYKVFDEIGPDRVEIYHMAICIFEDDNVLSAAYELPRTDVEQDFKAYLVPNGVRQRLFIASGDDNIYSADFCLIGYWDEQLGEIVHLSRTNNIGVEKMNLYTFPDDETVQLAYVDTYENDNGITQSRYISELENAFAKFGIVFQTSGERNAEAVLPDDTLVFSYSNVNDVQTNDSDIIDDDNATIAYGYVYTIGNVNMRAEPDLDASIIHTIPKDTRVEYTGSDSVDERGVRWFCVYHDGKTGWISSRYSTFAQDGTSSDEVQMPESSEVNDAYSLLNEEFADLDGDGQYERLVLYRVLDERLDDGFEIYHLAIHIFEEGDVLSAEYNLQQAGYSYDMLAYLVPDGARQRLFIESKTIEVEAPTARYCLIGYWDERISEELTVVDPGYTDADYLGLITSPGGEETELVYIDYNDDPAGMTQTQYKNALNSVFANYGIEFEVSDENSIEAMLSDDMLIFGYDYKYHDVESNENASNDTSASEEYGYVHTTGNVNMRVEPNLNASSICVIPKGVNIEFTGIDAVDERGVRWFCVYYDGNMGWISSKYAKSTESASDESDSGGSIPDISERYVSIIGSSTNLRLGPGLDYSITIVLHKGDEVLYTGKTVQDERGVNWYSVLCDDSEYWVSSKYALLQ